jgi:hypothetical protein
MQRLLVAVAALIATALFACASAAEAIEPVSGPGASAELARVYAQILRDPTNSPLHQSTKHLLKQRFLELQKR